MQARELRCLEKDYNLAPFIGLVVSYQLSNVIAERTYSTQRSKPPFSFYSFEEPDIVTLYRPTSNTILCQE